LTEQESAEEDHGEEFTPGKKARVTGKSKGQGGKGKKNTGREVVEEEDDAESEAGDTVNLKKQRKKPAEVKSLSGAKSKTGDRKTKAGAGKAQDALKIKRDNEIWSKDALLVAVECIQILDALS
jgi:hypothetical protein